MKDPPADLAAAIDEKNGLRGSQHHFTRTKDGKTLFRFKKKAT